MNARYLEPTVLLVERESEGERYGGLILGPFLLEPTCLTIYDVSVVCRVKERTFRFHALGNNCDFNQATVSQSLLGR